VTSGANQALGDQLALVNAILNATSGVLLFVGRRAIKAGKRETHKRLMIATVTTSAVFLICYLTRVALSGTHNDPHKGALHILYYVILGTHMILAMTVPVFAITLLFLGLKARYPKHRKIARWAFPIWMYVSITGVLVYVILYHVPA
jgi:putative membrane protein